MHSAALIRALRKALRDAADPAKAPSMQAYMKSEMPYLGVQAPGLRQASKAVFKTHPLDSFTAWRDTALKLWRGAKYREERYAAIELSGFPAYRKFQTLDALPIYEEMIVTGAWWDFVDAVASHRIGGLLRRYPGEMSTILREWAISEDMWKRRAAIIAQLGFKAQTDRKLLRDCIAPSMASTEFFLRKAIGWALRDYARTDAQHVIAFVRRHETKLSGLSKREALKNC